MKYRPEIDGLRAIAVLPVIFCHAGFEVFSGGFVGVDIFFVISGYLITLIIYGELQEERFSIVQFYERRVRRILPALFFVILVCFPFAWMWMMPEEFKDFCKSVMKVNLFISNIYFLKEMDYFAPNAQLAPMLHTWSLAVEEQFYVIFPLILILFKKISPKILLLFITILVISSLGLSEWESKAFPSRNYYLLSTRAWELGVGSILALSIDYRKNANGWFAQLASSLGLLLVLFAIFSFDETTPFPGLWALIPVLGAALIIAYARAQTLVGKVIGSKFFVALGLISYSAYLWHQPIFAFTRIRFGAGVLPEIYLGLSVLALFLAYLTWKFIEQPFRKNSKFTRRQVFTGAAIVSIIFISFGKIGRLTDGFPERLPLEAREMAAWAKDKNLRRDECNAKKSRYIAPEDSCVYGNELFPEFAILGDSHALGLAGPLSQKLIQEGHGLRMFTYNSCAPVVGYYRSGKLDECPKYNNDVQKYIFAHDEIKTVILFARWTLYLEGVPFNNKEGGAEYAKPVYGLPITKDLNFINNPARVDEIGQIYRSAIKSFLDNGKRVVLVHPVPEVGWHVPYYLAREILFGVEKTEVLSTSFEVFKDRTKDVREQFNMIGEHGNLLMIKIEEVFCNTFIVDRCVAQLEDGKPLYYDKNHLNSIGGFMLSEKIIKAMKEKEWL